MVVKYQWGRRSLEEQVLCNGVALEEEKDDDDVWSTPGGAQGLFPIVIRDHSGNYNSDVIKPRSAMCKASTPLPYLPSVSMSWF